MPRSLPHFPYNRDMKQIDLLVPFGLPHAKMAPSLLQTIQTPAFAKLIARAQPGNRLALDTFARLLPHEAWLIRQMGLNTPLAPNNSPGIATLAMQALGLAPDAGVWFMLQPVHLHIARDHLILSDMRRLALTEQESRALFDTAKPLFDEMGKTVLYGDAQTWFVRSDEWSELQTATPDVACGRNIDIWMPKGRGERDWRKLHNDVQMHWHTHAVNTARDRCSLYPVNALWLWGGAPAAMSHAPCPYTQVFNLPGWTTSLGQLAPKHTRGFCAGHLRAAAPEHGLLVLDDLIESALANDWSAWLQQLHRMETDWFAPLLGAQKSVKIDRLRLVLTHHHGLAEFTITRAALRKFWITPSLTKLMP